MIIPIEIDTNPYEIIVLPHLLDEIDQYINFSNRTMIITDNHIPTIYIEKIRSKIKNASIYTITAGEESKSLAVYEAIMDRLLKSNFTRKDMIIALGGGVVGDLAGFVAATYKRGCRFINIPTSTLAMVDSSLGGKVAINMNGVKNAIGTFYQPEKVLIDLSTLSSLPKRHFNNGLIEAIKAGLLGDKTLFELFVTDQYHLRLEEVIIKAIYVKKKIIEQDLYDQNIRQVLNLGHTLGHAIESYYKGEILHGEAVALGLNYVLSSELLEKLDKILKNMGVVLDYPFHYKEILPYILNDKKIDNDEIVLVKVDQIEKPYLISLNQEELLNIIQGE
ncbi:MAG TPA: 3-dehydroquinate synthase [Bacilli bacterium]|jgi:3-dehydroquinate synthase|nr:3-dehydroquinate synthase [Acholeplasmataceae bacterium]HNZ78119.1 3-dehydroquinate synthase [Bacilli bacterium]HOD61205.1 3-dehydroquinate synthase [Bacilli bacterium]HOH61976.1 3-dehydroquinate synthase [Bacilli bacterium]HPM15390.1 3-dehydroquinate synthase [Bacilli bacterium]